MTHQDFIKEVAIRTNKTQKDVRETIGAMRDVVLDHMKDDDGVAPFSAIKFIADYKEARIARNPQTGEAVNVPAKYAPKAKFGKAVKDALNY